MTALLAGFGRSLLAWVGGATLWCAVVLVVALVVDRLLRGRLRPGLRMALFVAVFVRAVLPVDLRSPVGAIPSAAPELTDVVPMAAAIDATRVAPLVVREPAHEPVVAVDRVGLASALVYGLGVLALLVLVASQLGRQRRILRACVPVGRSVDTLPVMVHDAAGPMVVGIRRPDIVVPRALFHRLAPDLLDAVLRHEAAHVRHRDPWSALALAIACAIAWPIVPVWMAAGRIRLLMELRADEAVVDGVTSATLRAYRKLLLSLADRPMVLAGFAPALGPVTALAARLHAMAQRARAPWVVQAAFVLPLALVLVAVAARRPDAATASPTPPTTDSDARVSVADSPLPMCRGIVRQARPAGETATDAEIAEDRLRVRLAANSIGPSRTDRSSAAIDSQRDATFAPGVLRSYVARAEAHLLFALAYAEVGDAAAGEVQFSEAAWYGASVKDDYLALEGAAGTVVMLARVGGRDDEARSWATHASAARRRSPDLLGPLAVEMERSLAMIAERQGEPEGAAEHRARAEELARRCEGRTD